MGTRSTRCPMPLAWAFTFHVSMSRVMPRSWATTIPLVTMSTWQPRSASSSAVEVAWWNPSSSTTTTRPAGSALPSRTSRTSTTRGLSPAHHGRAGRAPVATITASGWTASTSARVAVVEVTRSTPSRRAATTRLRVMSRNSARLGTVAATCTWPPRRSRRSNRVDPVPPLGRRHRGLQPAGSAADHHHLPAAAGCRGATVDSRPVLGFSMQPSQRLRPIRPTHSWLQERQVRMSVAWPERALAAKSGSAI